MLQKKSVATVVVLSIVTCGIYELIWYWNTIKALDAEGQSSNMTCGIQFLLMFLYVGGFIFGINADANMNAIRARKGLPPVDNKLLWVILGFVPIVQVALVQMAINEVADN